jgi:hypothetical protein
VSRAHYVDHLAPVWLQLGEEERGRLVCGSASALAHAVALGLPGVEPRPHRVYPYGKATLVAGLQPTVLVASWADYRATGRARCAWLGHGAGQHYLDDPVDGARWPTAATRRRIDLHVLPGPDAVALFTAGCPDIPAVAVGCPKLDALPPVPGPGAHPTVAITFHWEPRRCAPERRSAYPHWAAAIQELPAIARKRGWRLAATCHPKAVAHLQPALDAAGWPFTDLDTILHTADVLVGDNTSALFEAAAIGIRPVLLNAPWYRRDVEHGGRFWQRGDIGIQVSNGRSAPLARAIDDTLQDDPLADQRAASCTGVYAAVDGHAAERAATALRGHLP